jgi:hypothetical protein
MKQTELSGYSETVEFTKKQPVEVIQAAQVLARRLTGEQFFPRWAVNLWAEANKIEITFPTETHRTIRVTHEGKAEEMTIVCWKKKGRPPSF